MATQEGYQRVKDWSNTRRVCQNNPKATLRWTSEKEDRYQRMVNDCRTGPVIWVGTENQVV